ncbi:hypothetical protein K474DRAFT_1657003 [Panus rudis PR-1116 ss-1]|nr:hypothetical protein K474DRAFT_1657003 [Panus rudis PR-1116 ss-1]
MQPPGFPIQYFFDSSALKRPEGAVKDSSSRKKAHKPATDVLGHTMQHTNTPAERTSNWVAETQDTQGRPHISDSLPVLQHEQTLTDNLDPFMPVTYEESLPRPQREAYYQYLSDALGPAHGVQESVGSYRAFMTQQVQNYYDRITPPQFHGSPRTPAGPPPGYNVPGPSTTVSSASYCAGSDVPQSQYPSSEALANARHAKFSQGVPGLYYDFSTWAYQSPYSYTSSIAPSPAYTPTVTDTAVGTPVISECSPPGILWPWNASQTSFGLNDSPRGSTSLDISDILESPILRTSTVTHQSVSAPMALTEADLERLAHFFPVKSSSDSSPEMEAAGTSNVPKVAPADDTIRRPVSFSMSLRGGKEPEVAKPITEEAKVVEDLETGIKEAGSATETSSSTD